jgi:hypothetical protein
MTIVANGQQPGASASKTNVAVKDAGPAKHKIGIFGFGSLIADPGEELANAQ